MTENEITGPINYEEHTIITPNDVSIPRHIAEDYERMCFFCPKCDSSLIYMPEEYAKNNLMNSIKPQSDPSVMPDHQVNEGWMKVVLKCDNCKWADIVMKFMKKAQRVDYSGFLGTSIAPTRKRYTYTTPSGISTGLNSSGLGTSRYNKTWASSTRKARKMWRNTI